MSFGLDVDVEMCRYFLSHLHNCAVLQGYACSKKIPVSQHTNYGM